MGDLAATQDLAVSLEAGEAPPSRRSEMQPGAWGRDAPVKSSPVWIAMCMQSSGDRSTRAAGSKGKRSGTKRAGKKHGALAAEEVQEAEGSGVAGHAPPASGPSSPAPQGAAVHALPALDKIIKAAANQAGLIKKRDVGTARLFAILDPGGGVKPEPIEIDSDAVAQELLTHGAVGVVIVPDGGALGDVSEKCIESMRDLQVDIDSRAAALQDSRLARQLACEEHPTSSDSGVVLFWKDSQSNGYLSNWARSPFRLEEHTFNCAEQYIMWSKAVAMGDAASEQKILAASDPQVQKRLGKQVHPWKDSVWKRKREPVMLAAARAKFHQNQEFQHRLLKTYPKRLAEASPSDKVYGIGLAPSDVAAQDPRNWKGDNMLGRVLEQVRDELRLEVGNSLDPSAEAQALPGIGAHG